MRNRLNKKGENLILSPLIFIVLNIMFFGILLGFVFNSSNGVLVYEQAYAKQIALIIDSAKPGMNISLNMEEAVEKAKDEKWKGKIVSIKDNIVTVKLGEGGGYSYQFFNDVDFDVLYYYGDSNDDGFFDFEIIEKSDKRVEENEK